MSALGALEKIIRTSGDDTRIVILGILPLAGEGKAFGTEIVITLDEIFFKVANLQNLPRLKRDPEFRRAGHFHIDVTARNE